MTVTARYYRDLLRRRFTGRKAILGYGFASVIGKEVDLLRSLGCDDVFVLCEGGGTGTGATDFPHRVIGTGQATSIVGSMRAFEARVAALPADAAAELDAFDPEGSALVFRPLWGSLLEVAGRPVYNARPPSWVALEDKVIIDDLWDRAGVARAPRRIVAAEAPALAAAHRALDRGAGTVWAGDAREGWHGGGELTRWVVDEDHATAAAAELAPHCDRVRVMPFLEGIPCSIHGMLTPRGVAVLRPVEMITLRDPGAARLRYFGTSTVWDPAPGDREQMRAVARRVADVLADEVGFRGTFTVDGVMTEDGFLPTELNPRYGAGMFRLAAGTPELPLWFVDAAMCHGEPWDFRLPELEALLVGGADATRVPTCNAWDSRPRTDTETVRLARANGCLRRAADGEDAIGSVVAGPSSTGSLLRVNLDPTAVAIGPSIGPTVLEVLAFCDRELGTRFGSLASARSVR